VTVPIWAWVAFAGFVVTMLTVDLLVLHRRAREVSLKEAATWSAVWVAIGLGFGGLLWAWRDGGSGRVCCIASDNSKKRRGAIGRKTYRGYFPSHRGKR
jgi:hypothetical protein